MSVRDSLARESWLRHRDVQLLGHQLQGAGDVRHDLLAVVAAPGLAPGGLHQLEVVDDDQPQVFHPAALGQDIGHCDIGVLVDEDGGPAEGVGGRGHIFPVLVGQLAGDQLFVVHKALAGDQPQSQLLLVHFQGEKGHLLVGFFACVQQDIQGHGGLAHAGAGGQKDQVGVVQAGERPVQVPQAGLQAGDGAVAGGQLLQAVVDVDDDVGNGGQSLDGAALPDGVDALLRRVQKGLAGFGPLLDHVDQLLRGLQKLPQEGLVLDDLDVKAHIGGGGGVSHELEQIRPGLVVRVIAVLLQILQHRDRVDGAGVAEHGVDGLVDFPVFLDIKVVRAKAAGNLSNAFWVVQDGAQDILFCSGRVGRLPEHQFFQFVGHKAASLLLKYAQRS